jgi:Methyltransferase domain
MLSSLVNTCVLRSKKAFNAVSGLLRSVMAHPELTVNGMIVLPYTFRGMQFGREATFSNGNQLADKNPPAANPLDSYFESHDEGPGIWKWKHYFDIYHRHFSRFVGREVHVLEVGIYSGGSLLMWREYFGELAHIYGVDISEACRAYEDDRTKVFIGDQADRSFWAELRKAAPLIDIVIDDGGHLPEQQLVTLEEMLPHMRSGGVYLCEDIHNRFNGFAAYVQGLSDNLNESSRQDTTHPAAATSTFQAAINSIHLYPFAAVIEKCDRPVHEFVNPKRGTQWQPHSFWKSAGAVRAHGKSAV